jgi:cell division protein ZapA
MVNVNVKFNGRDYLLACEDGQEQELEKLAVKLNDKFNKLKKDLGNLGEAKLLLITAFKSLMMFRR